MKCEASCQLSECDLEMEQSSITVYFSGLSTSSEQLREKDQPLLKREVQVHRKTGVDASWTDDFPWLETSIDDSGEPGMWCRLCRNNNCRPKLTPLGKAVWIEIPCKTITRQRLSEHLDSCCHKEAMCTESMHILAEQREGISEAVVTVEMKAFIGHLKCMHFLRNIPILHWLNQVNLWELFTLEILLWVRICRVVYARNCLSPRGDCTGTSQRRNAIVTCVCT